MDINVDAVGVGKRFAIGVVVSLKSFDDPTDDRSEM